MTEELALEQLGRNRTAVDRHEGRFAALGMVVKVARHHFLAGAGLAEDENAGIGIGDLLHHLPHLLNRTTRAYQAAEQVRLALAATLAGLVVHLAVNLGAVQRIEELVVAGRHLQGGQHAAADIFRPLDRGHLVDQQHRQKLVPAADLLEQLQHSTLGLNLAKQHTEHVAAGTAGIRQGTPVGAAAGQVVFAEEVQNDCQVSTPISVVVDQQNLGFTPHRSVLTRKRAPLERGKKNRRTSRGSAGNWPVVKSKTPTESNLWRVFFGSPDSLAKGHESCTEGHRCSPGSLNRRAGTPWHPGWHGQSG